MPWIIGQALGAMAIDAVRAVEAEQQRIEDVERQAIAMLRALGRDEEAGAREAILTSRIAMREQGKQERLKEAFERQRRAQSFAREPIDDYLQTFVERKPLDLPEPALMHEQSWWPYLGITFECWVLFVRFFG